MGRQTRVARRHRTSGMAPLLLAFAAGTIALQLGGCAERLDIKPTRLQAFAPWSDTIPEHRLSAGDEIELRFLFNTELNDRVVIGEDGRATVPLLGPVLAEGRTVPEFTAQLKQAYAADLRVPDLDVVIRGYGSARVFIGGEVKAPGVEPMVGRMNVLQGVLLAGGPLPTARLGEVVVIRRNSDNAPMLRTVNLRALIGSARGTEDFPLQAADVVYVPRSDIADFDLFIDQYLNNAIPFTKSINANIGSGGFVR
ncbi:MAG: polysaccharide export protein [Acidisphaera sp.]|nr:polysaccharide export protein [Acidisphaera sp.]